MIFRKTTATLPLNGTLRKIPKAKNDNRSNLSEKLHYEVNLRRFSLDFLHNFQMDINFFFPLGN